MKKYMIICPKCEKVYVHEGRPVEAYCAHFVPRGEVTPMGDPVIIEKVLCKIIEVKE